jgi:hypothetical protein
MRRDSKVLAIRLKNNEYSIIENLTRDTGRTKNNIARILLMWAADHPEVKALLGDLRQSQP